MQVAQLKEVEPQEELASALVSEDGGNVKLTLAFSNGLALDICLDLHAATMLAQALNATVANIDIPKRVKVKVAH